MSNNRLTMGHSGIGLSHKHIFFLTDNKIVGLKVSQKHQNKSTGDIKPNKIILNIISASFGTCH